MSALQIVVTPTGPAVTHSGDFTIVRVSRSLAAGEVLLVFAPGFGPKVPLWISGNHIPRVLSRPSVLRLW